MSLADLLSPQPWEADALCREPEYGALPWFPEVGQDPATARAVCARCLARPECLEFALAAGIDAGVWGGETPAGLKRIRRERKAARLVVSSGRARP